MFRYAAVRQVLVLNMAAFSFFKIVHWQLINQIHYKSSKCEQAVKEVHSERQAKQQRREREGD